MISRRQYKEVSMSDISQEKESRSGRLTVFPEGTVILREGQESLDMFKIIKGHAEIYVGYGTAHESLIGIIGEQSCFGEFGLLLKKPSIYTVIAYSKVVALRISESNMGSFVAENHLIIMDIMKNMANSMLVMRSQIDLLLKELEAAPKSTDVDLRERKQLSKQLMRQYALHAYRK